MTNKGEDLKTKDKDDESFHIILTSLEFSVLNIKRFEDSCCTLIKAVTSVTRAFTLVIPGYEQYSLTNSDDA